MILNEMKLASLDFGNLEGSNEFSFSPHQKNLKIENTFYKPETFKKEDFFEKKKSYIIGLRGTGKTSIIKYLQYQIDQLEKGPYELVRFQDIRNNVLLRQRFNDLVKTSDDTDLVITLFWEWTFLSIICKKLEINDPLIQSCYIENSPSSFLRDLYGAFMAILFRMGGIPMNTSSQINQQDIYECLGRSETLKQHLNTYPKQFYLFVDEMNISIGEMFRIESRLVKNLIRALNNINDISENIVAIAAIRSEVLQSVYSIDIDDLNKSVLNKGYELRWHSDKYNIEHPLMKIMLMKIRFSMVQYNENVTKELNKKTDSEIFERWFPEPFQDARTVNEKVTYLMNNTWLNPRNMYLLFNGMKTNAENNVHFRQNDLDSSIKEYGKNIWSQMLVELSAQYSDQEKIKIEDMFAHIDELFTLSYFIDRAKEKGFSTDITKIIFLLHTLFRLGIIGNRFIDASNNEIYYFYYRGSEFMDIEKPFMLHKGLRGKFQPQYLQKEMYSRLLRETNSFNKIDIETKEKELISEALYELGIRIR
ncbi:MAG: P-loop ATPase, Sll1717 family [Campylobacterota bacterium]